MSVVQHTAEETRNDWLTLLKSVINRKRRIQLLDGVLKSVLYGLLGFFLLVAFSFIYVVYIDPYNQYLRWLLNIESLISTMLTSVLVGPVLFILLRLLLKESADFSIDNEISLLNNKYRWLEQSAQLLVKQKSELNRLQQLQIDRLNEDKELNKLTTRLIPRYSILLNRVVSVIGTLMLVLLIVQFVTSDLATNLIDSNRAKTELMSASEPSQLIKLEQEVTIHSIAITPPSYTKIAPYTEFSNDLMVIEGSRVEWTIKASNVTHPLAFKYSDASSNEVVDRLELSNEHYRFSQLLTQSQFYQLGTIVEGSFNPLSDIYSIAVTADQPPKVKISKPNLAVSVFNKNDQPRVVLAFDVEDDFGITDVKLKASVAKGSGEAVKFRDREQSLNQALLRSGENFQGSDDKLVTNSYEISWRLSDWQM
ncbi:MAG: DUF4175 family protein, partial [Kangiellaceae bacterium]|nr:DUF4175 family protein [Kangiellaceae bacterium]